MKKCTSFEEQKGAKYIRGNVYFGIIIFNCLLSTKACLRFILICFARELEGFYRNSLRYEVDFRDIINVSPNILAKYSNFKKGETRFCRWKCTDKNDINIFLPLENLSTFLLAKEKTWKSIFSTNSELSQNPTEKQIVLSKTTINWLFNGIWCNFFIACFDWKIGLFQQTVVRVYYIPKENLWKSGW